jgi:predicted RecA/RadA family phage recombinase
MKNFIQPGNTLTLPAPYDVLSGAGFQVGALFAIASTDALAGMPVEGVTDGVFMLPKTGAQAWAIGARIYWDDATKRCDTDTAKGDLIGVATAVAANPSSAGYVRLNGGAVSA